MTSNRLAQVILAEGYGARPGVKVMTPNLAEMLAEADACVLIGDIGMTADGSIIRENEQAPEVWVGTSFGFAALLLSEGMKEEAYHTAWGLYHVIYESKGYWFRTPEAWDVDGNFRASMYMRPAAVWAMEMIPQPDTK